MQARFSRHAAALVRLIRGLILVLAWLPAAASLAQAAAQSTAQVSVERANFRANCSLSADVMATLLEGAEVEILDSQGDWYRVRHLATGTEGCLHSTVLRRVTPLPEVDPEEELREIAAREAAAHEAAMREAADREAAAREAAEGDAEREAQRERREAELAAREAAAEQRAREVDRAAHRARGGERFTGYLDFNFGYTTPADDGFSHSGRVIQGNPPVSVAGSRAESEYRYDRDRTFGVAGGFLLALAAGGGVGAGASLTRATYSVDLDLQVSRPHRSIPTIIVADSITTRSPDRKETVLHLHAVYVPPSGERWRVRLFLGPSLFRSEVPVWSAVVARFPVNPPRMEIQRVEFGTREETVLGGHVGADVAYFLSNVFGIGASAVLSRATGELSIGTLDLEEPLEREVTLGGVSAMLGVRLRF